MVRHGAEHAPLRSAGPRGRGARRPSGNFSTKRAATLALILGVGATAAFADTFSPSGDDWKGTTLNSKWHVTVMGDAQPETNTVTVKDGTLSIVAGGSDIWNDNDNGIFLWQPAN